MPDNTRFHPLNVERPMALPAMHGLIILPYNSCISPGVEVVEAYNKVICFVRSLLLSFLLLFCAKKILSSYGRLIRHADRQRDTETQRHETQRHRERERKKEKEARLNR